MLKSRAGERCGAPSVPPGCPNGFKDLGDREAREMDLSVFTAENYLACCYVNISKTEVLPGIRHPVLGLMEEVSKSRGWGGGGRVVGICLAAF